MLSLEERAWQFAMRAHGSIDQRRKYTGLPYIAHPGEVVKLLRAVPGTTPEMLAAAWVHDTEEGVPWVTFEMIELELGAEVAMLVREVTKVSTPADGNRAARKALDRAHYARASVRGQSIKLADIISNITALPDLDRDFARVYLAEAAQLLDVLVLGDHRLMARAKATLLRGMTLLSMEPAVHTVEPAICLEDFFPKPPRNLVALAAFREADAK